MNTATRFGDLEPSEYPGQRLGLPPSGVGSITRVGRRLVAIFLDWGAATLLALGFAPYQSVTHSVLTLVWFSVLNVAGLMLLSGTPGHRIVGSRVVRINGLPMNLTSAGIRTALLLLVAPALVWDSDQRGFHDKVAGTALIRT